MIKYEAGAKYIVAASDGRGFAVKSEDVLAGTKNGKQILNVEGKVKAKSFALLEGHIAVGTNRRILIFPAEQLQEIRQGAWRYPATL